MFSRFSAALLLLGAVLAPPAAPVLAQAPAQEAPAQPQKRGGVVIEDEAAARANPDGLVAAAAELVNRGLLDQAGALLDRAEEFGADAQSLPLPARPPRRGAGRFGGGGGVLPRHALAGSEHPAGQARTSAGSTSSSATTGRRPCSSTTRSPATCPSPSSTTSAVSCAGSTRGGCGASTSTSLSRPTPTSTPPTSRREVSIFDLPFELDEDARETSGIGVDLKTSGRFDVPLTDNRSVLLRQTAFLRRLDYKGGDFDDTNLALSAGPLVRLGNNQEVSASALFGRRWFGDEGYSYYLGMRAAWAGPRHRPGQPRPQRPRAFASSTDEAERLGRPALFSSAVNPLYSLTPQSLLRGSVTLDRVRASDPTERSVGLFLGLGLFTELPFGFNIYAEPGIEFRKYDSNIPGFGFEKKNSITYSFEVNLRNRQLDFFGFTPLIGTVLEKRDSDIDLYDFERARFELGVTREF